MHRSTRDYSRLPLYEVVVHPRFYLCSRVTVCLMNIPRLVPSSAQDSPLCPRLSPLPEILSSARGTLSGRDG